MSWIGAFRTVTEVHGFAGFLQQCATRTCHKSGWFPGLFVPAASAAHGTLLNGACLCLSIAYDILVGFDAV